MNATTVNNLLESKNLREYNFLEQQKSAIMRNSELSGTVDTWVKK